MGDHPDQNQVRQHPRPRRGPDLRGPGWEWGVSWILGTLPEAENPSLARL